MNDNETQDRRDEETTSSYGFEIEGIPAWRSGECTWREEIGSED